MPEGETNVEVFANDDLLVQWTTPSESGENAVAQSSAVRIANSWSKTFNLSENGLVEIVTDVDAHLMVTHGTSGKTTLLGEEGNFYQSISLRHRKKVTCHFLTQMPMQQQ